MWHNLGNLLFYLLVILAPLATVIAVVQILTGPRAMSLLIFRYLRKRRIAWVSLIAVMLCTMMVLVVISVMGGWLKMFRESNHGLIGDIVVYRVALTGFEHYQEMIDEIVKLPEVKAAAPEIHTYALINIDNQIPNGVQVIGYDLAKIRDVNGFVDSLHLNPKNLPDFAEQITEKQAELKDLQQAPDQSDKAKEKILEAKEEIRDLQAQSQMARDNASHFPSFDKPLSTDTYRDQLPMSKADVSKWPGIIMGSGTLGLEKDEKTGALIRHDFMYRAWAKLTPLAVSDDASLNTDSLQPRNYWIIDDSHMNNFAVDANTVYVPFDLLQKDLKMDAQPYIDKLTGEQGTTEARANQIEISLKDPESADQVRPKIEAIVNRIAAKYQMIYLRDPIKTETWETRLADFLGAVEHEKGLLVILFAIISVVAVFLIFCIFFMIVVEKTRDIGIIKSVGATGASVAGIFLGYGLTIGLIGGGCGLLLGFLIVHNINWLHAWMGEHLGIEMWSAKTYIFDTIPNKLDPHDVIVIVSVAILASVLGALIPAIRAARMNPVEALRWE